MDYVPQLLEIFLFVMLSFFTVIDNLRVSIALGTVKQVISYQKKLRYRLDYLNL
jgi:putative Mn2+ efflux pump MntP